MSNVVEFNRGANKKFLCSEYDRATGHVEYCSVEEWFKDYDQIFVSTKRTPTPDSRIKVSWPRFFFNRTREFRTVEEARKFREFLVFHYNLEKYDIQIWEEWFIHPSQSYRIG